LPIAGLLLTVVKRFLEALLKRNLKYYMLLLRKPVHSQKTDVCPNFTSSLTVGLGGSAGLESPIVVTGAAFGSNYAQKIQTQL
jgi:CIC family chloride channel protein